MIVGLGNPGEKYARMRHNVGYRVIDLLNRDPIPRIRLMKPEGFMNSSGISVRETARMNGIKPEEIMVVCDDFSLPLRRLRMRLSGSSGGHNGLKSVLEAFDTEDVPRMRVG